MAGNEVIHFKKDDGKEYGDRWSKIVSAYIEDSAKGDVDHVGNDYKVLKRGDVTAFYDAKGNTLFDVENARIEAETVHTQETDAPKTGLPFGEPEKQEEKKTEEKVNEKPADKPKEKEKANEYKTGAEKLTAEENQMVASAGDKYRDIMKQQFDCVFEELIKKAESDAEFNNKVLLEHKSFKRCMKYASERAMGMMSPSDEEKQAARNGQPIVTPVSSDMLFQWIYEYYDLDDKEAVEKEKAAKKFKQSQQNTAPAKQSKKKDAAKKSSKPKSSEKKQNATKNDCKPEKQSKTVANKKDLDGQMDLFSMFSM